MTTSTITLKPPRSVHTAPVLHVINPDISQAYIHSRMRRRTADFLQGEITSTLAMSSAMILTIHSSPKGEARQRGKGAQDGQWTDVQGPRCLRQPLLGTPERRSFLLCLKKTGENWRHCYVGNWVLGGRESDREMSSGRCYLRLVRIQKPIDREYGWREFRNTKDNTW